MPIDHEEAISQDMARRQRRREDDEAVRLSSAVSASPPSFERGVFATTVSWMQAEAPPEKQYAECTALDLNQSEEFDSTIPEIIEGAPYTKAPERTDPGAIARAHNTLIVEGPIVANIIVDRRGERRLLIAPSESLRTRSVRLYATEYIPQLGGGGGSPLPFFSKPYKHCVSCMGKNRPVSKVPLFVEFDRDMDEKFGRLSVLHVSTRPPMLLDTSARTSTYYTDRSCHIYGTGISLRISGPDDAAMVRIEAYDGANIFVPTSVLDCNDAERGIHVTANRSEVQLTDSTTFIPKASFSTVYEGSIRSSPGHTILVSEMNAHASHGGLISGFAPLERISTWVSDSGEVHQPRLGDNTDLKSTRYSYSEATSEWSPIETTAFSPQEAVDIGRGGEITSFMTPNLPGFASEFYLRRPWMSRAALPSRRIIHFSDSDEEDAAIMDRALAASLSNIGDIGKPEKIVAPGYRTLDKPEKWESQPDAREGASACMICLTKAANHIAIPCGHPVACSWCANEMKDREDVKAECFACRTPMENMQVVWMNTTPEAVVVKK